MLPILTAVSILVPREMPMTINRNAVVTDATNSAASSFDVELFVGFHLELYLVLSKFIYKDSRILRSARRLVTCRSLADSAQRYWSG
jgi:hypothetical protein